MATAVWSFLFLLLLVQGGAHAIVGSPISLESFDSPKPQNNFGGTASSLTEAESQIAEKSNSTDNSSTDASTSSGSDGSASKSDGSDSKSSDSKISELEAFNKAERVKTDCNKLFNLYSQSSVDAKRYAAYKLFKSQHPECRRV